MEWFSTVAGYTWTDVVTVEQEAVTPGGEVTIPMKTVYSDADPRLELLQTSQWTFLDVAFCHLKDGGRCLTSSECVSKATSTSRWRGQPAAADADDVYPA